MLAGIAVTVLLLGGAGAVVWYKKNQNPFGAYGCIEIASKSVRFVAVNFVPVEGDDPECRILDR